jgi:hypothetical protein
MVREQITNRFLKVILRTAMVMGMILVCLMGECPAIDRLQQPQQTHSLSEAEAPRILSAFFGLDDALPWRVAFICLSGPGKDGMPVVFSNEIHNETLNPKGFRVTTASGAVHTPDCATVWPANEENEDRTVLLIGQFGSAKNDPPIRVEIMGDLRTEQGISLRGLWAEVTPLEAGPFLAYAKRVPLDPKEGDFLGRGGPCPIEFTRQVVRITWAGGVRAPSGEELGEAQLESINVTMRNAEGVETLVHPFVLADLRDEDNNVDLCLNVTGVPVRVRVVASTVIDPRGDPNPETEVIIQK